MCTKSMVRHVLLAVCIASAALLAIPRGVTAKGKPSGAGGGNGQFNTQGYWVWFSQDPLDAYEPEGQPPEASNPDGSDEGSVNVVAGDIRDENDPEMWVHGNATCLDSFEVFESFAAGPLIYPLALLQDDDFLSPDGDEVIADCLPSFSWRGMRIHGDGMTVQQHIPGLSTNGKKELAYVLFIEVIWDDGTGGVWDPLAIAPGDSVTLYLGEWWLTTVNPKHASWGCSAQGDFSDDVDLLTGAIGTAITISRWTLAEQAAHDACE